MVDLLIVYLMYLCGLGVLPRSRSAFDDSPIMGWKKRFAMQILLKYRVHSGCVAEI